MAQEAPSHWSVGKCSPFARLDCDRLGVRYAGRSGLGDCGTVLADRPVPRQCAAFYFEITVGRGGPHTRASIGLVGAAHDLCRQPGTVSRTSAGMRDTSVGGAARAIASQAGLAWRGVDGLLFRADDDGSNAGSDFGARFGPGDTVGCGLLVAERRAFFTKNGALTGDLQPVPPMGADVFAACSLHAPGDFAKACFSGPFQFDLASFVEARRRLAVARLATRRPTASVSASLVQQYLLFQGHTAALTALQHSLAGTDADASDGRADSGPGSSETSPRDVQPDDAASWRKGEDGPEGKLVGDEKRLELFRAPAGE